MVYYTINMTKYANVCEDIHTKTIFNYVKAYLFKWHIAVVKQIEISSFEYNVV